MKIWMVVALALVVSPASTAVWSQGAPKASKPKAGAGRADPCVPIGRTGDGQLVYGMACDKLPVPAAAASPAPATEPEERGGLFRNPLPSLFGSTGNVERESGVGPSTGGR